MDQERINRAQCMECGDTLTSVATRQWVTCKCGTLGIDGRTDYLIRSIRAPGRTVVFRELSVGFLASRSTRGES